MNLPVPRTTIISVCLAREATLAKAQIASDALQSAYDLAIEAQQARKAATLGHQAYGVHNIKGAEYLSPAPPPLDTLDAYRRSLDADIWTRLIEMTGMMDMMDRTAKEAFQKSLLSEAPEATEENITATLITLAAGSDMVFKRGLAVAFTKLDKRFKSHDGFKIGGRMILDHMFSEWGSMQTSAEHTLADIERAFAVLDKERPSYSSLRDAINNSRRGAYGPQQSETEGTYFKVRGFKNGKAHLWFTRDDLVLKANQLLAEYYGPILPDAYTQNEKPTGTAVSKDLQFYESSDAVVSALFRNLYFKPGDLMLEPSAGHGAIVREGLRQGFKVTAIEFDRRRAEISRSICANFLTYPVAEIYDCVVMNPPFFGTHWVDHIKHAFKFLKPGGVLRSVLPASAELNDPFCAWVEKHKEKYDRPWTDLPPESFASSGTNVQTVILSLRKPK